MSLLTVLEQLLKVLLPNFVRFLREFLLYFVNNSLLLE
ncbi:hypothetical protein Godav_019210, partial [Gossypium davidsonii]|nr:hypothetical protein [Gossypium davidsonii]